MFCSWYSRVLVLEEPDLPLELTQLLRLLLAGLHSALRAQLAHCALSARRPKGAFAYYVIL